MKSIGLLVLALIASFALPGRVACQDAPPPDTYKGDPLCHPRRGAYPHAVYTPEPEYDAKDRKKKVQGTVLLALIVTKDGETADIKVEKNLTPGLDQEAVKAVSRWKFEPMMEDGKPCPTRIKTEVTFHLY